jgi:hypothetical protein
MELAAVPTVDELEAPENFQVKLLGLNAYRRSCRIVNASKPLAVPPAGTSPNSTLLDMTAVCESELVTVP